MDYSYSIIGKYIYCTRFIPENSRFVKNEQSYGWVTRLISKRTYGKFESSMLERNRSPWETLLKDGMKKTSATNNAGNWESLFVHDAQNLNEAGKRVHSAL